MPDMTEMKPEEAAKRNSPVVELKIDGSRHTFNGTRLFSDRDCDRHDRYAHIFKELQLMDWEVRGEIAIPNGNVLQLNKKENWRHAKFYLFDIFKIGGKDVREANAKDNRKIIDELLANTAFTQIESPLRFPNFEQGWDYVNSRQAEGLVLKGEEKVFKVKRLSEAKVLIVGFNPGKSKGAFSIQMPGSGALGKVSGTAVAFVRKFNELQELGKAVYAEIEYCFLTDYGIPFQPRLRRVGTLKELEVT